MTKTEIEQIKLSNRKKKLFVSAAKFMEFSKAWCVATSSINKKSPNNEKLKRWNIENANDYLIENSTEDEINHARLKMKEYKDRMLELQN